MNSRAVKNSSTSFTAVEGGTSCSQVSQDANVAKPILQLDGISIRLPVNAGRDYAVHDLNLNLFPNEILCLVGESGSGKSMVSNAIMRLLPGNVKVDAGRIMFDSDNLLNMSEAKMREYRGAQIAMVFQDPMTALNPLHTIEHQIGEVYRVHTRLGRTKVRDKVLALLNDVQLPDPKAAMKAFPHELSGGQRQRAMIAMALALEPRVLIADEPTTALDVTTQAEILKLIHNLQRKKHTAVLFITHDFGVVAEIADRVAVLERGKLVEVGEAAKVLNTPAQPYTRKLIAAIPPLVPPASTEMSTDIVLEVSALSKAYRKRIGIFRRSARITQALDHVTLTLRKGATLGIVGESGSGKSTLARCIVRLLDSDSGHISIKGADLATLSRENSLKLKKQVQMVFQDPFASLNPRRRVGDIIAQGPITHGVSRKNARQRAHELLKVVGLDANAMDRFPNEFSGGERQRIGLARALAVEPEILVADEPLSGLDVSVQAQVLELLDELKLRFGLSMIFVTHDLRVAAQVSDVVAVMEAGKVVEVETATNLFLRPQAPYTQQLLSAIPGRAWFGRTGHDNDCRHARNDARPASSRPCGVRG